MLSVALSQLPVFLYRTICLRSHARGGVHVFHQLCCLCLMLLPVPRSAFFFWRYVAGNVCVLDSAYLEIYSIRIKKLFQVFKLIQPFPGLVTVFPGFFFHLSQFFQYLGIAFWTAKVFFAAHLLQRNAKVYKFIYPVTYV
jgi:hypothetical protein